MKLDKLAKEINQALETIPNIALEAIDYAFDQQEQLLPVTDSSIFVSDKLVANFNTTLETIQVSTVLRRVLSIKGHYNDEAH